MPDTTEKSPNDFFSSVIKESTAFIKFIYIEQRLPALVLILTIVSLVTVILSSTSDTTKQFLWFITIPALFFLTFFVLPKQGKEFQDIKQENRKLKDENSQLNSKDSNWSNKLKEVRDQINELTVNSLTHLERIEQNLNDIKSQVNEFLMPEELKRSGENLQILDQEISDLLEYVKLKKQEVDGLHLRIPAAEKIFQTAPEAAKFFAAVQEKMESDERTRG